jgi:stage II sporulation SpoAA-like protein
MSIDAKVGATEDGNLVHLELRGQMSTADQASLVYFVTKAVQRHGKIRLLVTLTDFAGWETSDDWDDAGMRIPDDTAVLKAAFVGDPRWKDGVFAFVAKGFRSIPIEYFPAEAAARAWLDT